MACEAAPRRPRLKPFVPRASPASFPPAFRRLAWSNLSAQAGEQIAVAAGSLIAVLLFGAGTGGTGLLQAAQTLPFLLLSIPAGVLADRVSRPKLMAAAEALRAASLVLVLVLASLGLLNLPFLALLGFLGAAGTVAYRRGHARPGPLAGVARLAARGERADRTGSRHGVRRRTGARWDAGRLDRRQPGIRGRGGLVGAGRGSAVRSSRAGLAQDGVASPDR